jgi:hypothetical protein
MTVVHVLPSLLMAIDVVRSRHTRDAQGAPGRRSCACLSVISGATVSAGTPPRRAG